MNLRDVIKKDLKESIAKKSKRLPVGRNIEVFTPTAQNFGDYSTNVAMKFATDFNQSPVDFAKDLTSSLKILPYVKKLEVKSPGFINFFIKVEELQKEVNQLLKKKKFEGQFSGKKIIVEFTDPNPFKEFHIGHLFTNSVGESIARILEATGAIVKRANYQGDVGLHVAKCIWGMREKIPSKTRLASGGKSLEKLKNASLPDRIRFLQDSYSQGAKAYETDAKARQEITRLNKQIYQKQEKLEEYKLGKKWSLEHFEEIYKRLGTRFDFYYFESEAGAKGVGIVRENLEKGIFQESEGAIIFPGEKFGLHNRVFITSQNLPTYEAKELGLAFKKYEDFAFDKSIIITGSEIVEYFKVLIAALREVGPDLAEKTHHIAHGMVRMPDGKISSRLGNVISATWILDEAKKKAIELMREKGLAKDKSEVDTIAEQIATGAVKYVLLKGNPGKDINFSFEQALTLEGNSAPYLQYTYARCQSVLAKAVTKDEKFDFSSPKDEELEVLRSLVHFQEIVQDASEVFAPNLIANFLYELAQKYNALYNNLRILDSPEGEKSRRLFLTQATAQIIRRGLYLLGIEAPQKM